MALLTLTAYRKITGDDTSTDGDVTTAIAEAQSLADDETRRHLESAERTEDVRVDRFGRGFPKATPVTAVATSGWTIAEGGGWLIGSAVFPRLDVVTEGETDVASLTYTGGYTSDTVPQRLARAIAELANDSVDPPPRSAAGARSVSVGDVSVTYEATARRADGLPAGPMAVIRAFRRRL